MLRGKEKVEIEVGLLSLAHNPSKIAVKNQANSLAIKKTNNLEKPKPKF